MKLDLMAENDHVIGVQTPPRKSYNPFDSDDEDTDAYAKSCVNGYDIKSFETTADSLTFHLDTSDLSWEEAILSHSRMLSNSMVADASHEKVLYRKDTELFTDKTITDCELPESFSNKDNDFHSVKDIGIDEGVPTHDKVWVISQDNHDSKTLSDAVVPDDNVKGDLPFEGLKSRPDSDVENDPFGTHSENYEEKGLHADFDKQYSADRCKTNDLVKVDESEQNSSKTELESNSGWQGTELVKGSGVIVNGNIDPNLSDKDEDHKVEDKGNNVFEKQYSNGNVPSQRAEESPAKPSIEHEVEANLESNKSQSEEVDSVQPVELSASQESAGTGSDATNMLSYNSKVDSGSIILDFNAAAEVSGKEKEEIPQKYEAVEKPPETQAMSRDDGATGPSILDGGTDKRVHGETSFSAGMPLPASITYMGPHVHNGSISLRSESSTGSTRSFAFPVLQTEWNSSPVRMAKADQRHLHKQRGWVHSLICCKF